MEWELTILKEISEEYLLACYPDGETVAISKVDYEKYLKKKEKAAETL